MYDSDVSVSLLERISNIVVPAMLNADHGHSNFDTGSKVVYVAWMNDGNEVLTISLTVDGVEQTFVEDLSHHADRDSRSRVLARSIDGRL